MELQAPKSPVPVFPLPNLVLFPHAVVPLHVFELRYRTMVREALSSERMIAMGLLKPGWERDYHGSPEFYPLGCLARFEEVEWLPNDCYSLVVRGTARVTFGRVVREYPYRVARVEVVPQEPYSEDDPLVLSEKHVMLELYRKLTASAVGEESGGGSPLPRGASSASAAGLAGSDLSFEELVNSVCMTLDTEPIEKLRLLGLDSVLERGHLVRGIAAKRMRTRPQPPPGGEHN